MLSPCRRAPISLAPKKKHQRHSYILRDSCLLKHSAHYNNKKKLLSDETIADLVRLTKNNPHRYPIAAAAVVPVLQPTAYDRQRRCCCLVVEKLTRTFAAAYSNASTDLAPAESATSLAVLKSMCPVGIPSTDSSFAPAGMVSLSPRTVSSRRKAPVGTGAPVRVPRG